MSLNVLSPLDDFNRSVLLELVDPTTGVTVPYTSGSATGFLATSGASTAAAADPAFSVSGVYIGGANGFPAGTWLFQIDAAQLTSAKCNAAFAPTGFAYFIMSVVGGIRRYEKLKFVDARAATIAA